MTRVFNTLFAVRIIITNIPKLNTVLTLQKKTDIRFMCKYLFYVLYFITCYYTTACLFYNEGQSFFKYCCLVCDARFAKYYTYLFVDTKGFCRFQQLTVVDIVTKC